LGTIPLMKCSLSFPPHCAPSGFPYGLIEKNIITVCISYTSTTIYPLCHPCTSPHCLNKTPSIDRIKQEITKQSYLKIKNLPSPSSLPPYPYPTHFTATYSHDSAQRWPHNAPLPLPFVGIEKIIHHDVLLA
jgi:hypothetical protein